jgi:hypothetical protein
VRTLPDCMAPDGAQPCKSWVDLRDALVAAPLPPSIDLYRDEAKFCDWINEYNRWYERVRNRAIFLSEDAIVEGARDIMRGM